MGRAPVERSESVTYLVIFERDVALVTFGERLEIGLLQPRFLYIRAPKTEETIALTNKRSTQI